MTLLRSRAAPLGPLVLAGCGASPVQPILGSYFPAWLICAVIGVVATAIIRQLLVVADLEGHLFLAPLTYAGMALGICLAAWLVVFG